MAAESGAHVKRIVLLLWTLVAFFYFYLSYNYIRSSMNDKQFDDYLQYIVRIAGDEQRPAKEVRTLILVRADELSLPLRSEEITILGGGQTLNVAVSYNVDIQIPLLQSEIYKKRYEHKVAYQKR